MGLRISLTPTSIESGNMDIATQAIRVPRGSSEPSDTGIISSGDSLSKRMQEPENSSRGTILIIVLSILSEVKCEFNLKSPILHPSVQIIIILRLRP